MKNRILIIPLALLLAISLLVIGCPKPPATTPPTTPPTTTLPTPAPTPERTEIVFGAVNSLTGAHAMEGAEQKWAYDQAVADINASGGIMVSSLGKKLPVRIVYEDDESTPDGGAAAMEKLIKVDHVDLVLSTNVGTINDAAATVADKYKIYYAGAGGWWGEEFEADHLQWSSCMFFTAASAAEVPFQIWDMQPADQRPQRVATLAMDTIDGKGITTGWTAMAQKHNYNIVYTDFFAVGTTDLSSYLLKMKAANADALLWIGPSTDGITLIRQIKAQNLNLKYIHGWMGFWSNDFVTALGADSNYCIHDGFWSASLPYPGNTQLDQEFKAAHNGNTSNTVGLYYAAVQVVAQAIENAGSLDSTAIRDAVFGHTFKGTTMGDVTFQSDGYCFTPSVAMQWWNGQRMLVWPHFASVNWQLKWMPPWNQR